MQSKRNIEKRTRYYQSLIDIDQLEKNMDYRKIKESYIIFICTFDPLGIAVKEFGIDIELVSEKYKVPIEDLRKAIL